MRRQILFLLVAMFVVLFAQTGVLAQTPEYPLIFGEYGTGLGQFSLPGGIAVDSNGILYVADSYNRRIQRYDGTDWTAWPPSAAGYSLYKPLGVTVDEEDNLFVYVADSYNNRILKLNSDGTLLDGWSLSSTGTKSLNIPFDVAVDGDHNLYVVDTKHNRVLKYNSGGELLAEWGPGGDVQAGFSNPTGVDVDSAGNVYVADSSSNRVVKLNGNGEILAEWGSEGGSPSAEPGQFSLPLDVAIDGFGGVYVSDANNCRIQKFDTNGSYLTHWGTCGYEPGQFHYPTGLAATDSRIYVADTLNCRIQIFGRPYDFGGFLSPISNPPAANTAKAGSAVPVKFSLGGDQGLDIFAAGYPASQEIDCATLHPDSAPLETIETAGDLSYDPVGDQYILTWRTDKAWAGRCRQLIVRLDDGTDHIAYFGFR
ncbi:MAG: PxKF domain-containing protein [Anaerolineae bacterium]|nr:PxKF domain-containing protein [Anaerolineae bacterium]